MNVRSRPPALLIAAMAALALSCSTAGFAQPAQPSAPGKPVAPATTKEKAVFGVSDADPQKWNLTLGNIANAMDALGKDGAEIELVAYGPGIQMLKKDSPVATRIAEALRSGVRIVACQNSMHAFHLEAADMAPGVVGVTSGVVELMKREHDGYAYIRS